MATALRRDPLVQLGEFLRAARVRAGLTLQQVSSTTKIPQRHLDAIEHGDLSVVPKGPYRRGEVRAFAEAVGVDQTVALERLEEALPPPVPDEPLPAPLDPVEPRSSWTSAVTLAMAVVGLIALMLWNRDTASSPATTSAALAPAVAQTSERAIEAVPRPSAAPLSSPAEAAAPVLPPVHPVLVVSSDPPGARIVVDDIGRGTTPATIEFLPFGEHRVRVVRDGYVSDERTITLTARRPTTTLDVDLRPSP